MKFSNAMCIPVLFALALGACSGNSGTASTDDSGTSSAVSESAAPMINPGMKAHNQAPTEAVLNAASSGQPGSKMRVIEGHAKHKLYLHDLMRRPEFSHAFHAMSGSKSLPGWVAEGGTATPAEPVTVQGKDLLLVQACKPHNCPGERVLLLYEKTSQSMQGLFVHDPSPGMGGQPSDKARMIWLGAPDTPTRRWLKGELTAR